MTTDTHEKYRSLMSAYHNESVEMVPCQEARAVYEKEPCARSFSEDVSAHMRTGFVISTPWCFVLARPVWSKAPAADIVNPLVMFHHRMDVSDCWHIYLMAGLVEAAVDYIPFPLPFISFERNNRLRVLPMGRFLRKWKDETVENGSSVTVLQGGRWQPTQTSTATG